jgi:hypothetical protein
MASVARNSPCPCGSGKRFKECHGAFATPADGHTTPPPPSQRADLAQLMHEALALQQEGRLADAIAKYETVVAHEPGNFDALHMLGVAWFQSNQLDRADDYVGRALAIRPGVVAAQSNRALIGDARRLAALEDDLCRQVLPKMSALSRASARDWPLGEREALDLVIAVRALEQDDLRVIRRIVDDPRFRTVAWRTNLTTAAPELKAISDIHQIGSGQGPHGDSVMVYGFDIPAAAWIGARVPAHVALVVNADLPCQLLDRVRELSDQGRSPIGIIFNHAGLRSASGLPGVLLDEWFGARSPQ